MKKKILDAFYAYEESKLKKDDFETSGITIPMTIICNKIHSRGKNIYERYGLTQTETDVLFVLYVYQDGLTAAEISERMVFSSGGISKILKKLETKELIYKKVSLEDKRSSYLYLKEKAKKIVNDCMPYCKDNDSYFFDVLNETEKEVMYKAFKKILYSLAQKEE